MKRKNIIRQNFVEQKHQIHQVKVYFYKNIKKLSMNHSLFILENKMAKLTLYGVDRKREEQVQKNKQTVANIVAKMNTKYEPPKIIKVIIKKK
jgi:hypothetical protein